MITTELYLDFARETIPTVVYAKQGDVGRSITVYLLENGIALAVPAGLTAELHIAKPDGTQLSIAATFGTGRTSVSADFSDDALSVAGYATADIAIKDGGKVLASSQPFYILIRPAAYMEEEE